MGLLRLSQKRSDGIDLIDNRGSLYYNKYHYRARLHCSGIALCWFCDEPAEVDARINKHKARWKHADADTVKKFIEWKNTKVGKGKNKVATIRVEGNTASVFSNDLSLLKELDSIGHNVDYTEVNNDIPSGTKYFKNEPEYKRRIYLKSKRVKDDFREKLGEFVQRYRDTDNKMVPSPSLHQWLRMTKDTSQPSWYNNNWRLQYCSSHYFLDFNEDSSETLFSLMFPGWTNRRFKLEKQP